MRRVRLTLACVLAVLAPAFASAAPAGGVEPPQLIQGPTADDLAKDYPERAQRLEVEGSAKISCVVNAEGRLEQCKVVHEWPIGYNFGDAALRLAPKFKASKAGVITPTIKFGLYNDEELFMSVNPPNNRIKLLTQPSRKDLRDAYPGKGDKVLYANLSCQLLADGRLRGCEAVGENQDPAANAAALKLIPLYRTITPPQALVGASTTLLFAFIPPDPEDASSTHPSN